MENARIQPNRDIQALIGGFSEMPLHGVFFLQETFNFVIL